MFADVLACSAMFPVVRPRVLTNLSADLKKLEIEKHYTDPSPSPLLTNVFVHNTEILSN